MAQLLDQHHNVICSRCQKYLSVFPVKVYEDGTVKCGRCCETNDRGVVSLYEKLAEHCLFECINKYEGCRKLLFPFEVAVHEETCKGKKEYTCPSCIINPQIPIQLVQHFKDSHGDYFLKSNILYLHLSRTCNEEKYYYIQDGIIFVIVVRIFFNKLFLSAATLCKLEDVSHQFIVSGISFEQTTSKRKCVDLGNFKTSDYHVIDVSEMLTQEIKLELILDMSEISIRADEVSRQQFGHNSKIPIPVPQPVEATAEFIKQYPQYILTSCRTALYSVLQNQRIELTCFNCKQMMASETFICSLNKHMVCRDCSTWCVFCNAAIQGLNNHFVALSKTLLFSCKWQCRTKCKAIELRIHEQYCDMNKQKCPLCHQILIARYFKKHLSDEHSKEYVEEFDFTFSLKQRDEGELYFTLSGNLLKLSWKPQYIIYGKTNEIYYNVNTASCVPNIKFKLYCIKNNKELNLINGNYYNLIDVITKPKLYLKYE